VRFFKGIAFFGLLNEADCEKLYLKLNGCFTSRGGKLFLVELKWQFYLIATLNKPSLIRMGFLGLLYKSHILLKVHIMEQVFK
jgi:hypothetical protein